MCKYCVFTNVIDQLRYNKETTLKTETKIWFFPILFKHWFVFECFYQNILSISERIIKDCIPYRYHSCDLLQNISCKNWLFIKDFPLIFSNIYYHTYDISVLPFNSKNYFITQIQNMKRKQNLINFYNLYIYYYYFF